MKPGLSLLLSLILAGFFVAPAQAQQAAQAPRDVLIPVIPPIPEGQDVHEYVAKGQAAPYAGYLFDGPTALRWGNWLTLWRERYRIDMTEQRNVCSAQVELKQELLRIEQERARAVQVAFERELAAKKNDRPWYLSFEAGMAGGIVVGLAVVVVTGYSLKNID